jgi:EPS-associated MarR family transcriptional regulator
VISSVTRLPAPAQSDPDRDLSPQESLDFELLYLLEHEPGLSQREIARRLGISLGRANYCLRALLDKGALKLANFRASSSKLGYAYVLTPSGLATRAAMTARFLKRKLADYDRLRQQIEALTEAHGGRRP